MAIKFRVWDKWHGKEREAWVYSDNPCFEGRLSIFFSWIEQHQKGYEDILLERIEDGEVST